MQCDQLKGCLLLATPSLRDPNFHNTLILLCHQDQDGSMGLIINKEQDFMFSEVLTDLHLNTPESANTPVLDGGPIDNFRGFILHDGQHLFESTLCVSRDIHLTTSRDIVEKIADGSGPSRYLFILGYAGWHAGQLEQEISHNDWLITESNPHILFETRVENRWMAAANVLGISHGTLSGRAGHA